MSKGVKYRHVHDNTWQYLYIDIKTLDLLIKNFGIIATKRTSISNIMIDSPITNTSIDIKYCGASIMLYCKNRDVSMSSSKALLALSQNY
jgi:hypothetical protein